MEVLKVHTKRHMTYRDAFGSAGSLRDAFEVARRRMVAEQLVPNGIRDERVLAAMGKVPRHMFVGKALESQAYLDRPLHIGMGQTISQPAMVALMSEALELKGGERVLEIGTGSGYQCAVLAELAREVFTIERIAELSVSARKAIYRLRYSNIQFRVGDGTLGWIDAAPFDGIVVTAGAPCVPDALMTQLADGGRLVIPVGNEDVQTLEIYTRKGENIEKRSSTACRFVKLIGEKGW